MWMDLDLVSSIHGMGEHIHGMGESVLCVYNISLDLSYIQWASGI